MVKPADMDFITGLDEIEADWYALSATLLSVGLIIFLQLRRTTPKEQNRSILGLAGECF